MRKLIIFSCLLSVLSASWNTAGAQRVLTLDECKQLALENNNDLKTARQQMKMAGYDTKIAASYFYPKIQAVGTYQRTDKELRLIPERGRQVLEHGGDAVQKAYNEKLQEVMQNPDIQEYIKTNPEAAEFFDNLAKLDLASPINAIGSSINNLLTFDIRNIYAGLISVEQPVFVGGKIVASHKMAKYAQELSEVQYEQAVEELTVDIEQAYWQIISISFKKQLAEAYSELLRQMITDTQTLMDEGFATESDFLTVKVKANEAEMLLTKASNGLVLSKMLLCQKCGLPLESGIVLADENLDHVPVPQIPEYVSIEDAFSARTEIRSLNLANQIYDKKVVIARADMMPTLALTANYLISKPNLSNGFNNKYFGGRFAAGVVLKIPIFHGTEALQRTRKAKAEAELYKIKLNDAKEKINLQIVQCRKLQQESVEKLAMAQSNVDVAEENLRMANEGYTEGVISSTTVLAASTAWLKAHSELIDTGVEVQMSAVNLAKAEGRL